MVSRRLVSGRAGCFGRTQRWKEPKGSFEKPSRCAFRKDRHDPTLNGICFIGLLDTRGVYDVVHHHGDDDVDRVMVPRGDQRERQRKAGQPPHRAAKDVAEKDKAARVATEHEIVLVEKERCVQGRRVLLVGANPRLITRRERGQA